MKLKWQRVGDSVPEDERIVVKDSAVESLLNASSSTHNLPLVAGGTAAAVTDVERATWQQEKQKLYQMLDDKVHCCSFLLNHCMYMVSVIKSTDCHPVLLSSRKVLVLENLRGPIYKSLSLS